MGVFCFRVFSTVLTDGMVLRFQGGDSSLVRKISILTARGWDRSSLIEEEIERGKNRGVGEDKGKMKDGRHQMR